MKKSVTPLYCGYNGEKQEGTLVKFDSMDEVEAFIKAYTGKIAGHYSYGHNEMVCPRDTFEMKLCLEFIKCGDPALNNRIMEKAELWKNLALDIHPSFMIKKSWDKVEQSESFDAGQIASGDEKPCFSRTKESDTIQEGKGDGSYRIIINTDVTWWCTPEDGAAAMGALCLLLQEYAPVEVWVQQGWMGGYKEDGVTLFPVLLGNTFSPVNLAFWTGHQYKDSPFSYMVNRMLGRRSTAVQVQPELPCDLYMAGFRWPQVGYGGHNHDKGASLPDEVKAAWVADAAAKVGFIESLSGWKTTGDGSEVEKLIAEVEDE